MLEWGQQESEGKIRTAKGAGGGGGRASRVGCLLGVGKLDQEHWSVVSRKFWNSFPAAGREKGSNAKGGAKGKVWANEILGVRGGGKKSSQVD